MICLPVRPRPRGPRVTLNLQITRHPRINRGLGLFQRDQIPGGRFMPTFKQRDSFLMRGPPVHRVWFRPLEEPGLGGG